MNIKSNKGVTLVELMIAITIGMTLVMSTGSGIYLSGVNLIDSTVKSTQAYRNAQIVLMHIGKNVSEAGGRFNIVDNVDLDDDGVNDMVLHYRRYSGSADIYQEPTLLSRYMYFSDGKWLEFTPDVDNFPTDQVIFNHIADCNFSITPTDGVVLNVTIIALDNNDNPSSAYTLNTHIEATATASPAVF